MRPHPINKRRRRRDQARKSRKERRAEKFGNYFACGMEMSFTIPGGQVDGIQHHTYGEYAWNWKKKKFERLPDKPIVLGGSVGVYDPEKMAAVESAIQSWQLHYDYAIETWREDFLNAMAELVPNNRTLRVYDLQTGQQYFP